MLKRIFLNYKARKQRQPRDHVSYEAATKLGLLFNQEEFTGAGISELKEMLERDGKSVTVLGFENKPSEDPLLFNRRDISMTGVITKNHLEAFVKQPFDFLLTLGSSPNINYRYVLGISQAACKIGFETEYYGDLLQMSLQLADNSPTAIEDLVKYLRMIS